jgi:hypothetical protein
MKLGCNHANIMYQKIDHGTKWDETTWILEACGWLLLQTPVHLLLLMIQISEARDAPRDFSRAPPDLQISEAELLHHSQRFQPGLQLELMHPEMAGPEIYNKMIAGSEVAGPWEEVER